MVAPLTNDLASALLRSAGWMAAASLAFTFAGAVMFVVRVFRARKSGARPVVSQFEIWGLEV